MRLTNESGHLTKAGLAECQRLAALEITQEHRLMATLLREIQRRDILLRHVATGDLVKAGFKITPHWLKETLTPGD